MSWPSNTIRPAVGVSMRSTASPVVDLPRAAFADQTERLAAPDREGNAVDRFHGRDLALDDDALGDREMNLQILDA